MIADGYTQLPPGKLAALVTYLVHPLDHVPTLAALPASCRLERLDVGDTQRYRTLFAAVGQDWLWFSRLRMREQALGAILASSDVHAFALADERGDIGILELDLRNAEAPELAYFGLVNSAIGQGLGAALMAQGLALAIRLGVQRLQVHTCSLDHPGALAFYVRNGFRPVSRAIEVFDDPRLDGTLPQSAAAFMPLIPVEQ